MLKLAELLAIVKLVIVIYFQFVSLHFLREAFLDDDSGFSFVLALPNSFIAEEQLILLSLGDTPDNLDRRRITSATLGARLGQRGANRFSVYANLAEMRLDTTAVNDSSRAGGGILYSRRVSPLSTFGVELSGYTLDYINTMFPLLKRQQELLKIINEEW